MSHDSADPSTPQRPLPSPLDEAAVTPSRLGLLQTPPRRPGRGLKRPAEAEPDAPGAARPVLFGFSRRPTASAASSTVLHRVRRFSNARPFGYNISS
ncbi:hypothetical protein Ct61P_10501 [Colletotrichum tofieldiae]|nr:hypothetical protein Ct61P_10501 [Colletotrichum tofieldiae]